MATTRRALPWLLRAGWVAVLVVGGAALDDALVDRSSAPADVLPWVAFAGWMIGVIAMAVPSVVGLTATRLIVPLAPPVAVVTIFAGATTGAGWALVVIATLTTVLACTAEVGRVFAQSSAYGEEDRYPLRPPAAYLLAAIVIWSLWASATIAAPLLLVSGNWWLGAPLAAVAVGGAALGWPRWHRLSRRWFVVVPVGIVLHDHLVLAETVMIRRHELNRLRLAPADTEAADLTGPASGHAVEFSTFEPTTVIFAATPEQPRGRAIHLTAGLFAPSRPGAALGAAAARQLPVG